MKIINWKKYYTSEEIDNMVKVSIKKNAEDLAKKIKKINANKVKSNIVEHV